MPEALATTTTLRERIVAWAEECRVGGANPRWWFCLRVGRDTYLYLDEMIVWATCKIWGHEPETTPAFPIFTYCAWCHKDMPDAGAR
jgi:hypothetical protein